MPDGVLICVDICGPLDGKAAPLIGWDPYGKHGHTLCSQSSPKADVDDARLSPGVHARHEALRNEGA